MAFETELAREHSDVVNLEIRLHAVMDEALLVTAWSDSGPWYIRRPVLLNDFRVLACTTSSPG